MSYISIIIIKSEQSIAMNVTLNDKSLSRCFQCNSIFTPFSHRYYCCDKNLFVCEHCKNIPCKLCQFSRDRRVNIICSKCRRTFNEDQSFYDFKADHYFCAKCMSSKYIYYYEQMVKENTDPAKCIVKLNSQSEYGIQDLILFFKSRCFCCLKVFKNNAFEMKHGARICSTCLESNIELALPKLIMCVQCNGYIHDLAEIKFSISYTEVFCIYCAEDQAKSYEALKKKTEAESNKHSKLITRSSLNNSGVIISANHLSKIKFNKGNNFKEQDGPKMIKIISKESIDVESIDCLVPVTTNPCTQICCICNCFFNQSSIFTLHQQQIQRLGLEKQLRDKKKSIFACLTCYNRYVHLVKVKSNENDGKFVQFKTEKQLSIPQQASIVPSIQSAKQISSPIRVNKSPHRKIFGTEPLIQTLCCICKKSVSSCKTSRGMECSTCAKAFKEIK